MSCWPWRLAPASCRDSRTIGHINLNLTRTLTRRAPRAARRRRRRPTPPGGPRRTGSPAGRAPAPPAGNHSCNLRLPMADRLRNPVPDRFTPAREHTHTGSSKRGPSHEQITGRVCVETLCMLDGFASLQLSVTLAPCLQDAAEPHLRVFCLPRLGSRTLLATQSTAERMSQYLVGPVAVLEPAARAVGGVRQHLRRSTR